MSSCFKEMYLLDVDFWRSGVWDKNSGPFEMMRKWKNALCKCWQCLLRRSQKIWTLAIDTTNSFWLFSGGDDDQMCAKCIDVFAAGQCGRAGTFGCACEYTCRCACVTTCFWLRFLYAQQISFQIWVERFGVYVHMSDLRALERCSVLLSSTHLSCNFCGRTCFYVQEDLRRHLYMAHGVAQCRKTGCHRLLHDEFARDVHENLHHPAWASWWVCECVCMWHSVCHCAVKL